jgi:hypothetical protein
MSRIPLATDIKTRTGAPAGKDARLVNSYIETKGEQSVVRKRLIAQGGVLTKLGTAQGGIGITINDIEYVIVVNEDTLNKYDETYFTDWDVGTPYKTGDKVVVDFVDYWALDDNTGNDPTISPTHWSEEYVPAVYPVPPVSSWTVGTLVHGLDTQLGSSQPIAWNGSIYCYLARSGTSSVLAPYTSIDGINWTQQADTAINYTNATKAIIWAGTKFVALPVYGFAGWVNATSTNGITWTDEVTSDLPAGATDIAWSGTVMCAIVGAGAYTSTNAINWTYSALPFGSQYITWNGSVFCATYYDAWPHISNLILTSPDGVNWSQHTLPMNLTHASIASMGSTICLMGVSGYSAVSNDNGSTWTLGSPTYSGRLSASNSMLLNAPQQSYAYYETSTDGINWTTRHILGAAITDSLKYTVFGNKFLVATAGTYVATSATGL